MQDSVSRFSNRVANYIKYRPNYPMEIIQLLDKKIGLTKNLKVADIGSGTGISAINFLKNGNEVIGIEPNDEMGKAAESLLADYKNFSVLAGNAEETNLENNSIDLILASQAFHWFNHKKAKLEFKRILKKDGWVVLIWNEKKIDSQNSFMQKYGELIAKYGTDYHQVSYNNITSQIFDDFFKNYSLETLPNFQYFNFEGLKGRLLSSSYIPLEGEVYEEMIIVLKNLYDEFKVNDKVVFEYETKIYYGKL